MAARTKIFPNRLFLNAYRGWDTIAHPRHDRDKVEGQFSTSGVVRYDSERAYNGYTFFTSGGVQGGFLADMHGNIVHEWYLPFDKIWDKNAAVTKPAPPKRISWRDGYLFPNGDLLVVYEAFGFTPWGYGLVKMDRNSKPIWTFLENVHHDVDVGPDGKVYTLTQSIRKDPFPDLPEVPVPAIEDFAVVLSPDGKLLKKVSVFEAFAKSRYRRAMELTEDWSHGDELHTNAITLVTAEVARRLPFAHIGEVLLSFRKLDAIALLDLDSEKIDWFLTGPWRHQHDPEVLANGHMMLFDNDGDIARGGRARVLEFDPRSLQVFWEYPGTEGDQDFDSALCGSEQMLPNGNVLITESGRAEILEVAPDQKTVWEYRSPLRVGHKKKPPGWLLSGFRFATPDLHFDFNGKGHIPGLSEGP
jgi:hypothetical protein